MLRAVNRSPDLPSNMPCSSYTLFSCFTNAPAPPAGRRRSPKAGGEVQGDCQTRMKDIDGWDKQSAQRGMPEL